jgi:hypothetical protein
MISQKYKMYRGIKVKYIRPSARIKFIDERFKQSKTISYSFNGGDTLEQAIKYLSDNGFNIAGYAEMENYSILFCDNWGAEGVKLKSLK